MEKLNVPTPEEEKEHEKKDDSIHEAENVELSSEEVEKIENQVKKLIRKKMDSSDSESDYKRIIKAGHDLEKKELIKEEALSELQAKMSLIDVMEDDRLEPVKNKLQSTIDHFKEL